MVNLQLVSNSKFPLLVAIVGGSGSGKSWLAEKLRLALHGRATRISLDDFYRDRSHLPPSRRAPLNFDNPASIDWPRFRQVLQSALRWHKTFLPCYDFKTHCRLARAESFVPKPIILVDGLWLLRKPAIRRFFSFRIFLDCTVHVRLRRRLARDLRFRGRSRAGVSRQFWKTVQPMHEKFVQPQSHWADLILRGNFGMRDVKKIATALGRVERAGSKTSRSASKSKRT